MDFDSFSAKPVDFIQEWIQTNTKGADFGIEENLRQIVNENPHILRSIPLINSILDIQQTPPGKLVRVRCVMRHDIGKILVPRLIETKSGNFSYLSSQFIPDELELPPPGMPGLDSDVNVSYGDRLHVVAQLVEGTTEWIRERQMHEKLAKSEKEGTEAKTIREVKKGKITIPETTFILLNLNDTKEQKITYSKLIDVIGYFEDASNDLTPGPFNTFSLSLPTLISFAVFPVKSVFEPVGYELSPDNICELREKTLQLLCTVFEPQVAEVVLLWFISRTRVVVGSQNIGNLSLNLRGVAADGAQIIAEFLASLCSSITYFPITIENLNKKLLMPELIDEQFTDSPFNTFDENRFILDETCMTEGTLTDVGSINLSLFEQLSTMQKTVIKLYELFEVHVSNPVLVLSDKRSLIDCSMSIEINELSESEAELSEEDLTLIRLYIDQARFLETKQVDISKEEILISKLVELRKRGVRTTQEDLHTYTDIALNLMLSYGMEEITQEIADHALAIYDSLCHQQEPAAEAKPQEEGAETTEITSPEVSQEEQ